MKFVMMAESSMMRNTKSTVPVPSPKRGVSQAEIWSLMPVPALVSAEVATTAKARIIIVSQGMPSLKVLARDTKELPFFLIRKPAMTRSRTQIAVLPMVPSQAMKPPAVVKRPGRNSRMKNAARNSMMTFWSLLKWVSSEENTKSLFLIRLTSGLKMNLITSRGAMPAR